MVFEKKNVGEACRAKYQEEKTECQRATDAFEGLVDSTHGMAATFYARNAPFKKKKKKKTTTTNTQKLDPIERASLRKRPAGFFPFGKAIRLCGISVPPTKCSG